MTEPADRSARINNKRHIFALTECQGTHALILLYNILCLIYFIFQNFISLQHENCFT